MAEQLRCRPGDLAVIVPVEGLLTLPEDMRFIGAFVTCVRYIGNFQRPEFHCRPGGGVRIELHCVARAWDVRSPLFPHGKGIVSDDCLRPIRGNPPAEKRDRTVRDYLESMS